MTERLPKIAAVAVALALLPIMFYLAYSRPYYFSSGFLGGLIVFEFLLLAVWLYRRIFFVVVMLAFLFAGMDLPLGGIWTSGRWFFLIAGASIGFFIMLKERRLRFGVFHAFAMFAALSAIVSALVSRYPVFAFLKATSLLLLFVYAGTGARLAVVGREQRFFSGLLLSCEIFVGAIGTFYFFGIEAMGNPNSLGAVMCIVAPVILWGTLIDAEPLVHHRRLLLYALCTYLLFYSHARAALAAAALSCALLCLALHRYKLLGQGVVIVVILAASAAIFNPAAFSERVSSLKSSVIYKDRDSSLGVFASRQGPWQGAMDGIHKHFWFGSGFGTTDTGQDASAHLGNFSSNSLATAENGTSYLTIISWVGLVGVLPFVALLLALLHKVMRTILWMLNTGNPFHPAVPLAMIVVAGLLHAGFEDWLFAPGYYLCVFFWSLAFALVDLSPWAPLPSFSGASRPWLIRQGMDGVVPSR